MLATACVGCPPGEGGPKLVSIIRILYYIRLVARASQTNIMFSILYSDTSRNWTGLRAKRNVRFGPRRQSPARSPLPKTIILSLFINIRPISPYSDHIVVIYSRWPPRLRYLSCIPNHNNISFFFLFFFFIDFQHQLRFWGFGSRKIPFLHDKNQQYIGWFLFLCYTAEMSSHTRVFKI